MVKLRLAFGKGAGTFAIVAAESRNRRDGKCIKKLGYYNPRFPADSERRLSVDLDEVSRFISDGAQPTERVAKLVKAYSAQKGYKFDERVGSKVEEFASYVVKA